MKKNSSVFLSAALLSIALVNASEAATIPAGLFISAGPAVSAATDAPQSISPKDAAIEREFSCINERKAANQNLDWDTVCYAPSTSASSQPALAVATQPVSFEIGTDIYSFSYTEDIFDLEEKGLMYGVYGIFTLRPSDDDGMDMEIVDVYQVEGRFNYGKVDYESRPSGTIDDITDYTLELRGLLGKDMPLGQRFLLTPYIGLAYRYLNDDTGGMISSTGARGYERESRYFYLPVGAELAAQVTSQWKVSVKGEYDVFLQGEQTSKLSDVAGFADLENDQESGFGFRVSGKLSYMAENYEFFVEPFYRYWHIEDSNLSTSIGSVFITTGYEPENETQEIGGRIGVKF